MFRCHVCKEEEATLYCTRCGKPACPNCLSEGICWSCSRPDIPQIQNPTQHIQEELAKWNWGGFGCSSFWAAAMNRWGWFFLGFIPFVAWFVEIYLGFNGNKLAWESRRWNSFEQFQETQRIWGIWGKVFFGIYVVYVVVLVGIRATSVLGPSVS
jgi:hypothetical protein